MPVRAYARRSGPLSREGSLSCHTCCKTGPRFFRSHPKDLPIQSPFTTNIDDYNNKFGFPESLKCHLFGINKFYRASCA